MSTPILATKLYLPPPRPNVVLRPRLSERLNAGLHGKLTLIAAPAGFGKTTLVSAWIALCERLTAWLSLDEADSDPARFLSYLVAALQTIAPTIGAGLVDVLQSPQPPPAEAILTALINDITTILDHFILVLDDYHVIDAKPVDTALTFLLEHLPPQMHLVIATREDPQLPLARFRVRSQLNELRAAGLRFTPAEAAAFLREVMDLDLAAEDVAALERRTEGWIAGLQLAALSMRGRNDIAQFVQAFAGDNRYIVDYLVDEVLQRQPEQVRSFLLQTAILDRLHGPLCDAVTSQERGQAQLEALHRGNFFVVPLDDRRQWYRYHHLFAEVLAAQLRAEQPELLATLHRRASAWYEHMARRPMRSATRWPPKTSRAANLVERAWTAMRRMRQDTTRRRPGWHRAAGRLVVVCGLLVGLSALWMTLFYPWPKGDGALLYAFRLVFGLAMVGSIVLGFTAIRRRDVRRHRAWMLRGYAIGLGAGTQALTLLTGELIVQHRAFRWASKHRDRPQLMHHQSHEAQRVRRRRTDTGLDGHAKGGDGVQVPHRCCSPISS